MNINELAIAVHEANIKWWQCVDTGRAIRRNEGELLALVISELSECLEGERKDLMDDKLTNRKMAEVEMADAKIRLLDFAAGFGYGIERSIIVVPPANKGEAIFRIMKQVARIESHDNPGLMIGHCIGMIQAYCEHHDYDLDGAFNEKMEYNRTREDHTHEARKIAGGKQF